MNFDKTNFSAETLTLDGIAIRFRAWRNLSYADRPADPECQRMNIFAPEAYYEGESINGYDINSAPIFMPNTVGDYMPGQAGEPGLNPFGPPVPNSIFHALAHGYLVAAPALRGRTLKNADGAFTGKAPPVSLITRPLSVSFVFLPLTCPVIQIESSPTEPARAGRFPPSWALPEIIRIMRLI